MRWLYIAVIALFALLVIDLAVENFQPVTISLFGYGLRLPMVLFIVILYVLGMVSGSGLWALLRRAVERSKRGDGRRP